jgi:hypothetical protein
MAKVNIFVRETDITISSDFNVERSALVVDGSFVQRV